MYVLNESRYLDIIPVLLKYAYLLEISLNQRRFRLDRTAQIKLV